MKVGVKVKITTARLLLSETMLKEFELRLSIKLPQDYRDFMLEHNGGYPAEAWDFDFIETGIDKSTSSIVSEFYSIDAPDKKTYNDIATRYVDLVNASLIPPSLIPIADDVFGNPILLSVSGDDYGHVYFANHELEDTETRYMVMSPIADSFTEFISKLYIED